MVRSVYLTIDDGPSARGEQMLDYLNAKNIGAVLFCRGNNLEANRKFAIRAIGEGYIIGNHSYDHPHFSTLNEERARAQIKRTEVLIDELYLEAGVARSARFFRFPYGDGGTNGEVSGNQRILEEYGFWAPFDFPRRDWRWNVIVNDWHVDRSNVAEKLEFAKQKLRMLQSKDVLVLHDHAMNLELNLFDQICSFILGLDFHFHSNDHFQALVRRKETD